MLWNKRVWESRQCKGCEDRHAAAASWQGPKLARQNVTEDPESGDSGNPDTITLMAGAEAQI